MGKMRGKLLENESDGVGGLGLRLVDFSVNFVGVNMWLLLLSCSKVQEWVEPSI